MTQADLLIRHFFRFTFVGAPCLAPMPAIAPSILILISFDQLVNLESVVTINPDQVNPPFDSCEINRSNARLYIIILVKELAVQTEKLDAELF